MNRNKDELHAGNNAEGSTDKQESAEESGVMKNIINNEVINQVSLLQGLTFGDYTGSVTVAELKKMGDIGIGTFDKLNGELIMLDGVVYRAAGDGSVEVVNDDETIPFADVTYFDNDEEQKADAVESIDALKELLNKKVEELGENRFYMVRIDGVFPEMHVRSELAQEKPYQPLAKVLETDQTFYDFEDVKGTVVGLYCPAYMNMLNAVGWHFHFISDDRQAGGHVVDLRGDKATIRWDYTQEFSMKLPDSEAFKDYDLTVDQSEDIKKVETGDSK